MNKHLKIEDIQKEIDSIVQRFTFVSGAASLHDEGQTLEGRLAEIRNTLREYLRGECHNLNVLKNGSAAGLHKARQVSTDEVEKIKKLIEKIGSALDRYHYITSKTGKHDTNLINRFDKFEEDNMIMKSEEKEHLQVTYQTIALLDTERYGSTGNEAATKYRRPDLGSPTNQRNCDVMDKIRLGLGKFTPAIAADYQIALPKFFNKISGGGV